MPFGFQFKVGVPIVLIIYLSYCYMALVLLQFSNVLSVVILPKIVNKLNSVNCSN